MNKNHLKRLIKEEFEKCLRSRGWEPAPEDEPVIWIPNTDVWLKGDNQVDVPRLGSFFFITRALEGLLKLQNLEKQPVVAPLLYDVVHTYALRTTLLAPRDETRLLTEDEVLDEVKYHRSGERPAAGPWIRTEDEPPPKDGTVILGCYGPGNHSFPIFWMEKAPKIILSISGQLEEYRSYYPCWESFEHILYADDPIVWAKLNQPKGE